MKKLTKTSFYLLISGVIVYFVSSVASFIYSMATDFKREREAVKDLVTAEEIDMVISITKFFTVVTLVVVTIFAIYFIKKILSNQKTQATQGYVIALLVIGIISAISDLMSLASNLVFGTISLLSAVCFIVGAALQMKEKPYSPDDGDDIPDEIIEA